MIGIDQGTTGTTCIAFDKDLRPVARAYEELANYYPQPGWVEQDPEDVVRGVVNTVAEVLQAVGGPKQVRAVGLANQGETVVAWNKRKTTASTAAIVWSDARAEEIVTHLREQGHGERVAALTGLRLDPYFSAAKFAWLLENESTVKNDAASGDLCLGTLDTWLAWRLGGERLLSDHATASRTQLLGLSSGRWEAELLNMFGIPKKALATVRSSLGNWGELYHPSWGGSLPWRASLVDQPGALAGNACFAYGETKVTYGTGCFLLANAGKEPVAPPEGLLATIAWSHEGRCTYAFDGGAFTAGTAVKWLQSVNIISSPEETTSLAESVQDTGGVRFLPAITGLGSPWWHNEARGLFSGITGGTTRRHLTRAVLDAVAFRVRDMLEALWATGFPRPSALCVDGGLTKNSYLMQRQADVLGLPIRRLNNVEATATGVAALAGIAAGILTEQQVRSRVSDAPLIKPKLSEEQRETEYAQWRSWLEQARKL